MRDIGDSEIAQAQQLTGTYLVDFAEMIIDSDSEDFQLRFSTLYRNVSFETFDGTDQTFTAAGHLLSIGSLSESLDAKQNSIDVTLSGLDPFVVQHITSSDPPFLGSPVNLYRGFWSEEEGRLIGKPYVLWRGVANDYATGYAGDLGQNNEVQVVVSCKNLLVSILDSVNGRYTSVPSFQQENPNDQSMSFVASLTSFNPQFGKED